MAGMEALGDPGELILGLLKGAPSDEFVFKKVQEDGTIKDYRIRVQLLRVEQDHGVLREAQQYSAKQGEAPKSFGDIYKNAQAVELLTIALRRTEQISLGDGTKMYPPLFTDSKQLRASFTAPEMAQCLNMYELVKAKYGAIETFSEEEYDLWRDRLADAMRGPFFLSLLDSGHWPQLMYALAAEAKALRLALGLPLSTSLDSSASGQTNSASGIGDFSTLPDAQTASGEPLPTDHLVSPDEAKAMTRPKKTPK